MTRAAGTRRAPALRLARRPALHDRQGETGSVAPLVEHALRGHPRVRRALGARLPARSAADPGAAWSWVAPTYEKPYIPTRPLDCGRLAAHSTESAPSSASWAKG